MWECSHYRQLHNRPALKGIASPNKPVAHDYLIDLAPYNRMALKRTTRVSKMPLFINYFSNFLMQILYICTRKYKYTKYIQKSSDLNKFFIICNPREFGNKISILILLSNTYIVYNMKLKNRNHNFFYM